jgi:DNA-binding MarR family transcriptional regulator
MTERAEASAKGRAQKRARAGIRERTEQAFQAYLDLIGTANWFGFEMEGQLAKFNLSMERFRLLELLHREGPMTMAAVAERQCCARQSLFSLADRLARFGWVRLERMRVPAAEVDENNLAKHKRGAGRVGRRATSVRLTSEGEKFIEAVIRRHKKLVYAFMCGIDPRSLERLRRTCRQLREGDIGKMLKELMMEEA